MRRLPFLLLLLCCCAAAPGAQNSWQTVDEEQPFLLLDAASVRKMSKGIVECRAKILGPRGEELLIDLRYDMDPPAVLVLGSTALSKDKPPVRQANPNSTMTGLGSLGANNPYVKVYGSLKRRGF